MKRISVFITILSIVLALLQSCSVYRKYPQKISSAE